MTNLMTKACFGAKVDALQSRFDWVMDIKLMEAPGWLNLVESVCEEVKAALKDSAKAQIELFTVRVYNGEPRIYVAFGKKVDEQKSSMIRDAIANAVRLGRAHCFKCGDQLSPNDGMFISSLKRACDQHSGFDSIYREDAELEMEFVAAAARVAETTSPGEMIGASEVTPDEPDDYRDGAVADEDDEEFETCVPKKATLKIYDVELVKVYRESLAAKTSDAEARKRLDELTREMLKLGGEREFCAIPEDSNALLQGLREDFPNFKQVVDHIEGSVALAKRSDGRLVIPPLLLAGNAGVGKTQFASELAARFNTGFHVIHMESEQNSAGLSGTGEHWANAQTGEVFNLLLRGKTANPLVLLDEVDKVGSDKVYDPLAAAYQLLELESAKHFVDQSIRGLTIDASAISWLLTANDVRLIPVPIQSRVEVFEIQKPTPAQSLQIARRIYRILRASHAWGKDFDEEVSDALAEQLAKVPPRRIKKLLLNGFGVAAAKGRNTVLVGDVSIDVEITRRPMGFIH